MVSGESDSEVTTGEFLDYFVGSVGAFRDYPYLFDLRIAESLVEDPTHRFADGVLFVKGRDSDRDPQHVLELHGLAIRHLSTGIINVAIGFDTPWDEKNGQSSVRDLDGDDGVEIVTENTTMMARGVGTVEEFGVDSLPFVKLLKNFRNTLLDRFSIDVPSYGGTFRQRLLRSSYQAISILALVFSLPFSKLTRYPLSDMARHVLLVATRT